MTFRFVARCHPDAIEIRLFERKFMGRPEVHHPEDWGKAPAVVAPLVRRLRGFMQDGRATPSGDALFLANETAAELPETTAAALGFPAQAAVTLNVTVQGTIGQPNCFVETRWTDANYRSIEPRRTGIELAWGNRVDRLSGSLFTLIEAIDAFNDSRGPNVEARIALWAKVRAALERVDPGIVSSDDYARTLTIFQAGSFALDVRLEPGGVDFTPVLMGREKGRSLEDDIPGAADLFDGDPSESEVDLFGGLRSDAADALLVPEDHKAFLRQFANPTRNVSAAYVLGRRSTYVLLDPDLRQALDVVKRVRQGSEEEKRDFIRNPRPAIAHALRIDGGDALVTALFVETQQYSDRVIGLGVWERPELPWLTKASTTWVPETFPIRIDGEPVEIGKDEIDRLKAAIEVAEDHDEPDVPFRDRTLPLEAARDVVTDWGRQEEEAETRRELDEATMPLDPERPEPSSDLMVVEADPAVDSDQLVLQIKTNIDELGYLLTLNGRRALLPPVPPPEKMALTRFKPHQETGFSWLVEAWAAGWPGVLLADDMGLGKSFQALAFLAWIKANQDAARAKGTGGVERGPVLVVAPTALLQNWIKEAELHLARNALGETIQAFGSGLRPLKNSDPGVSPDDALDHERLATSAGWVLTTYETLADNHRSFARIRFSVALFDEMQKIKDPRTLNTFAAKAMNADFVLGLTGTPVENRIEDLWSIMDRIVPGRLGDLKAFSTKYANPAEDVYRELKETLTQPHQSAPPIMLRRMKEDNLEGLPSKEVQSYRIAMPKPQAEAYDAVIREARAAKATNRNAMLQIIQRLRSVSLYPDDPAPFDLADPTEARKWAARSARLTKTIELLRDIDSRNEKALVFIEHRDMQSRFAEAVATLFGLEINPAIINGSVPGGMRQSIVDRFQNARTRFGLLILSPKAAGIGLTITAANHVIHLSRWWNPAVEDQCNDRVYRIGQDRDVTIHLPIAVHPQWGDHTFDVTLDQLLERKRTLSRTLLAPPVADEDVDQLFKQTVAD